MTSTHTTQGANPTKWLPEIEGYTPTCEIAEVSGCRQLSGRRLHVYRSLSSFSRLAEHLEANGWDGTAYLLFAPAEGRRKERLVIGYRSAKTGAWSAGAVR